VLHSQDRHSRGRLCYIHGHIISGRHSRGRLCYIYGHIISGRHSRGRLCYIYGHIISDRHSRGRLCYIHRTDTSTSFDKCGEAPGCGVAEFGCAVEVDGGGAFGGEDVGVVYQEGEF